MSWQKMSLPEPRPSLIVRYDYPWADEHDQGRDDAARSRPCVVVVANQRVGGELLVTVVPVAVHRELSDFFERPRMITHGGDGALDQRKVAVIGFNGDLDGHDSPQGA